jgi:hypothetical protein
MAEIDCRALGRRARHHLATITEINLGSSLLGRLSDLRVAAATCRRFP